MTTLTPRLDNLDSGKNLAINGNFDFWQRGLSVNSTVGTPFLADRFRSGIGSAGTTTCSTARSTDVPSVAQSGYASLYSQIFTITGTGTIAAGGFVLPAVYSVEGSDYQSLHGRPFALSFWVKGSVTGTYCVAFRNGSANRSYIAEYTVSSANTWERKFISLQADTAGTWALDNSTGMVISWSGGEGVNGQSPTKDAWVNGNYRATSSQVNLAAVNGATFLISQIMILPGEYTNLPDVSIPFRRAGVSIARELQFCQRYYEKSYDLDSAPASNDVRSTVLLKQASNTIGNSETYGYVPFKTTKRATPTMSIYSYSGGSGRVSNGSTAELAVNSGIAGTNFLKVTGINGFEISNMSGGSVTTNQLVVLFHYVADAEI